MIGPWRQWSAGLFPTITDSLIEHLALTYNSSDPASSLLLEVVTSARKVFETSLQASLGHQRTNGSCLYGVILCECLIRRFTDGQPAIRGGDGVADGGLFKNGVGYGHYWIEVALHGETLIVDITGDQFGLDPVVVAQIENTPAEYRPGCQVRVDAHVRQLQDEIQAES